jgi:hypothetical protein
MLRRIIIEEKEERKETQVIVNLQRRKCWIFKLCKEILMKQMYFFLRVQERIKKK